MFTYTVFCQERFCTGTIWIEALEADNVDQALEFAQKRCAEAWEMEADDIHVLGVAEGDVRILYWEDQE